MAQVQVKINKSRKGIVAGLILGILFIIVYILIGMLALEPERTYRLDQQESFVDNWTIEYEDGCREVTSLPTKAHTIEKGETVKMTNTLPVGEGYNMLFMWNYGHDIVVCVENEEIFRYDEEDVHGIGSDRPYMGIYVDLEEEYFGKEIEIYVTRTEASSESVIGHMAVGSALSVVVGSLKGILWEVYLATLMLILGVLILLISLFIQGAAEKSISLKYLAIGIIGVAAWMIFNSTGRQFIFENVSSVRNCAFFVVGLLPVPFALFFDEVMGYRYNKFFHTIEGVCLASFATLSLLHITDIVPLSVSFFLSILWVFVMIFGTAVTLIIERIKKNSKDYRLTAIGLEILGMAAILQIWIYFSLLSEVLNGLVLGIGLIALAVCATIDATKDVGILHIRHRKAVAQVQSLSKEAMETIARTVDAKDPYTSEHSSRVSKYSVLLAQKAGWSEKDIEDLQFSALLHDIGKIGVPDSVLNKPAKLTDEEFAIIKSHTTMGGEILANFSTLRYAETVALHHHERYDGRGYPSGMKGEDIPEVARLVCIADSYDAMHSRRVYRNQLDDGYIREELIRCRGTQFDPYYLDLFLELLDEGKLDN